MEVPGWEKADMFENLTEKLQRTFKNLRGQGKLTEEHLDAALAEMLADGTIARIYARYGIELRPPE